MAPQVDFAVIGAGIVGLSVAQALRRRWPAARIAVLEKEAGPGRHASGRNSGVVHSGIYYPGGTLKSRLCSDGAARMRAFAAEHRIPCVQSGKVILAVDPGEVPVLDRLVANAAAGAVRVERIDAARLRELEPHAGPCAGALYSPDTAVIDSGAVVARLAELVRDAGVDIRYGWPARGIDRVRQSLDGPGGAIGFGYLVNCAGAHADTVAGWMGAGAAYATVPFKGLFAKLRPDRTGLVRGNIYPVPDLNLPFLGVHMTRGVSGEVSVGPTAVPALGREHYGWFRGINPREGLATAWHLARQYAGNRQSFRRLVHTEARRLFRRTLIAEARRLVPAIRPEDVVASAKVGIRPQLVHRRDRTLVMDYVIEKTPESLHVLNAISPAFTCAFAFAEFLAGQVGVADPAVPVPA